MLRKFTLTSFLPLLLFPFMLLAQDDTTECPYFNVTTNDSTGVLLSLVSTDVDATISGVIADVHIEQMYINEGDSTLDATYVFPMSSKAAVYGMEMDVNDRTIIAEIRRKSEAQEIFDNADSLGLTASLLELNRPNVFQMSLANINPGDTIIIRMVYTELMTPVNGEYQFVFPSIVGPRYNIGGESWAAGTPDQIQNSALIISLKINAGMAVVADCISHDATFSYTGTSTTETFLATSPGDDFIVNYRLNRDQIVTGLLLYEGEEENFFLSMVQPPKPEIDYQSPPREYVFIMDVSGSMAGAPIELSKSLITNLINDLNSTDKFNVIFFSNSSTPLFPASVDANNENLAIALSTIDEMVGGGGTQIIPAMELALNIDATEDFARTFVILTDGYVTVEKEAYDLIRENLNEANFFSFGIGSSVNRFIIEGIAYVGEGEATVVTDDHDPQEVADAFKAYIEKPALTNIRANFQGVEVYDVEPLTTPDVFAERPIIIYGKYNDATNGSITIEGDYSDGTISSTLSFNDYKSDAEENIALQYLWARKKIRLMSDYGIASNETDTVSIEEEITQLGLKYNLVTDFTSFVAVDSLATAGNENTSDGDDGGDGDITSLEFIDNYDKNEDIPKYIYIKNTLLHSSQLIEISINNKAQIRNAMLTITNNTGMIQSIHSLDDISSTDIIKLPLENLPTGIYFLTVYENNVPIQTEKFVIVN